MGKIGALAQREFGGLFHSLIGYIVIAMYLVIMGFFFAVQVFVPGQPSDMRELFQLSIIALVVVIPILTMGMFSEEYNSGRIEVLRTSPITEFQIVAGKFLGAMGFYFALVASTLIYLLLLMIFGHPNYGSIGAGYLGLILLGTFCLSVGLFFSSVTRHQIIAALCAFIVLVLISFASRVADVMSTIGGGYSWWVYLRNGVRYVSFWEHMTGFAKGVVDTGHVFYFLGGTFLFLLATYLMVESRRWR